MKKWLCGLALLAFAGIAHAQTIPVWILWSSSWVRWDGGPVQNPAVGPYCTGTPAVGDIVYWSSSNCWQSLAIGSTNNVLTVVAGLPAWQASAGGSAFSAITSGTNTTAAMVVGTGGSLTTSGSGSITASAVAAGAVGTAGIANSAVTYAKIQNETNATLLGNDSGGSAAPSEITLVAPLNFPSSTSLGVSITTTNDGGAVVKQASSPGTQQGSSGSANFNLNGIGILETDSLGPATAKGLVLQNPTASSAGTTTQWSPAVDWQGTGWNSSGSASQVAEWRAYVAPQTVAGTITSRFFIDRQDNGGGFTTELQIADNGTLTANGGITATVGNIVASGNNQIIQVTGTTNNGTGGLGYTSTNGSSVLYTAVRSLTGTCSGSTTCAGGTNLPANFVPLAVAVRITTAITGSTTYEIGTSNNPTAFCTGVTTVAINSTYSCGGGSTNATGQSNTAAAAPLLTSTVGGNFTAGVVEMIFYGIVVTNPTS